MITIFVSGTALVESQEDQPADYTPEQLADLEAQTCAALNALELDADGEQLAFANGGYSQQGEPFTVWYAGEWHDVTAVTGLYSREAEAIRDAGDVLHACYEKWFYEALKAGK